MASWGLLQGAAQGAAKGIDVWMDETLARAKEDRLRSYQVQDRADDRAYQEGVRADDREYQEGLLSRTGSTSVQTVDDEGNPITRMVNAYGEGVADFAAPPSANQNATANERDVQAMVAAGYVESEAEGWEVVRNRGGSVTDAVRIAEMMRADQESNFLQPGDPGYKTPAELLDTAFQYISRQGGPRSGAQTQPGGNTTAGVQSATTGSGTKADPHKPTTEEEFNALPAGAYYIDPEDNLLYRK